MPRPLPLHPQGLRRRKPRTTQVLLACPRVDPKWELGALRALIKPKPQTRGAVEHRDGMQSWPADGPSKVRKILDMIEEQFGLHVEMHFPEEGEYFAAVSIPARRRLEGLALAAALSAAMPDLWFVYGRLFLQAGKYFRRERGFKLWLVEASNVCLPREMRSALRDVL